MDTFYLSKYFEKRRKSFLLVGGTALTLVLLAGVIPNSAAYLTMSFIAVFAIFNKGLGIVVPFPA